MNAVVDHFLPVDAVFLLEVLVEACLDVLNDRFPTVGKERGQKHALATVPNDARLSSLSTKSPKPGVSTTVSLRRTPFSSMMCETVWISVVERMTSSGFKRPLDSMR